MTLPDDFDLLQTAKLGSRELLDAVGRLDSAGMGAMIDAELKRRWGEDVGKYRKPTRGWFGATSRPWEPADD